MTEYTYSNKTEIYPLHDGQWHTPPDDHTAVGDYRERVILGATIGAIKIISLAVTGKWVFADANTATAQGLLAFCMDGGILDDVVQAAHSPCRIRHDSWSLTIGSYYYISATAGDITDIAPAVSGDTVRKVGYAVTAEILHFDPSPEWEIVP